MRVVVVGGREAEGEFLKNLAEKGRGKLVDGLYALWDPRCVSEKDSSCSRREWRPALCRMCVARVLDLFKGEVYWRFPDEEVNFFFCREGFEHGSRSSPPPASLEAFVRSWTRLSSPFCPCAGILQGGPGAGNDRKHRSHQRSRARLRQKPGPERGCKTRLFLGGEHAGGRQQARETMEGVFLQSYPTIKR